jgi:hypothetical protein
MDRLRVSLRRRKTDLEAAVRGAQDFIANGTTASWDDSSSAE